MVFKKGGKSRKPSGNSYAFENLHHVNSFNPSKYNNRVGAALLFPKSAINLIFPGKFIKQTQ